MSAPAAEPVPRVDFDAVSDDVMQITVESESGVRFYFTVPREPLVPLREAEVTAPGDAAVTETQDDQPEPADSAN